MNAKRFGFHFLLLWAWVCAFSVQNPSVRPLPEPNDRAVYCVLSNDAGACFSEAEQSVAAPSGSYAGCKPQQTAAQKGAQRLLWSAPDPSLLVRTTERSRPCCAAVGAADRGQRLAFLQSIRI